MMKEEKYQEIDLDSNDYKRTEKAARAGRWITGSLGGAIATAIIKNKRVVIDWGSKVASKFTGLFKH